MKQSVINRAIANAGLFFEQSGWALPPNPIWDVTDFGLGDFGHTGLVLINLADEPEYCEKLMYAIKGQTTPAHHHKQKKEDIICRKGLLQIQLWAENAESIADTGCVSVKVNGQYRTLNSGDKITLQPGERITITPGIWHEFYPLTDECIIGEVSTANDDVNDNFFLNKEIGRFSEVVEDEEKIYC